MGSPMQLDDIDITFRTEMSIDNSNIDESLDLNLNDFKIEEPKSIQHAIHENVLTTPIDQSMRRRISTPVSHVVDNSLYPKEENPIEKYKELIISSASKKQLQRYDEKIEPLQAASFRTQESVVSVDPTSHKIRITIDPDMILKYLSVISKAFIIFISIALCCSLLFTFYYEVNDELKMQYIEKQAEIQQCYKEYSENMCDMKRPPKMEEHCTLWEKCMRQDPFKYNKMNVIPKVMGKIVEHFVDVLSLKSLLFLTVLLIVFAYTRKPPTYIMNLHQTSEEMLKIKK
eukprot:NODE_863_length_3616_cov_0.485926.p1 type:complete len:287 gc:universal NODE_863_length_3616_cov_0.485926:1762-2622(+)